MGALIHLEAERVKRRSSDDWMFAIGLQRLRERGKAVVLGNPALAHRIWEATWTEDELYVLHGDCYGHRCVIERVDDGEAIG